MVHSCAIYIEIIKFETKLHIRARALFTRLAEECILTLVEILIGRTTRSMFLKLKPLHMPNNINSSRPVVVERRHIL